jgi:hypothetical protein
MTHTFTISYLSINKMALDIITVGYLYALDFRTISKYRVKRIQEYNFQHVELILVVSFSTHHNMSVYN